MLYVNFSVICLKFAPKWSLSYFQPILVAIFVTIETVNIESIPDFNTWTIVLITFKKQFSLFSVIGGPKKPLNAVPLSFIKIYHLVQEL